MMVPCTKPAAPQQSNGTTIARNEPCLDMNALVSTPSAKTEPTERSMPPLMMTKVMPAVMMPMKLAPSAMLRRLSGWMNPLSKIAPMMTSRIRTANAPLREMSEVSARPGHCGTDAVFVDRDVHGCRRDRPRRCSPGPVGSRRHSLLLLRWMSTAAMMTAACTIRVPESGML